jgi:hypothetical protein
MAVALATVAVTLASAASAYAQTDVDTTFAGGTPAQTYVAPEGTLLLNPAVATEFEDGPALPADWSSSPWSGGGASTVTGGALVVDGARAGTTATYARGHSLTFVATFGAAGFEHVGLGVDFDGAPWAMFSTGGGGLPQGLYARTLAATGETEERTQLDPGIDPLVPHRYRIVWTASGVTYFVDGVQVASHLETPTVDLRPLASDFAPGDTAAVKVDWVRMSPYEADGTFESRVFDAGDSRALWKTITADADTPAGTSLSLETRTGTTATPDGSWTAWQAVGAGGAITAPAGQRYAQYRATLGTTDQLSTPSVRSVTIVHEVDSTAPTTSIDGVTVTGPAARVAFSSEAGATFECSLDGAAFAACTSPHDYSGLTAGSHTVKVRATDAVGNTGTAAEQPFTVTAPATTIDDIAVTGTGAQVTFSGPAGATFECSLDGAAFAACTSPVDYAGLSFGPHTFSARATDGAGNTGAAATQGFNVPDTTPPTTTIDGVTVMQATARVAFSSEAGATFACSLDGGAFVACTSPHDYTGLTAGAHTVSVRATDTTGNTGAAVDRGFTVVPPSTTIQGATVSGTSARLTFSGPAGATFQCSLDGAAFQACTSPTTYSGLPATTHTVRVRAIDTAGNVGAAAAKSFTIAKPSGSNPPADLTAPKIRPLTRTVTASKAGKVKLALACPDSETSCRIVVKLRYKGKTIATKTFTVTGDASRSMSLKLGKATRTALIKKGKLTVHALTTATDAAGNAATTDTKIKLKAPK